MPRWWQDDDGSSTQWDASISDADVSDGLFSEEDCSADESFDGDPQAFDGAGSSGHAQGSSGRPPGHDVDPLELKFACEQGMTIEELKHEFACTANQINYLLRKHGLQGVAAAAR